MNQSRLASFFVSLSVCSIGLAADSTGSAALYADLVDDVVGLDDDALA